MINKKELNYTYMIIGFQIATAIVVYGFINVLGELKLDANRMKVETTKVNLEITKEKALSTCVENANNVYQGTFDSNSTVLENDSTKRSWNNAVVEERAMIKLSDDKDFCLRRYK